MVMAMMSTTAGRAKPKTGEVEDSLDGNNDGNTGKVEDSLSSDDDGKGINDDQTS